MMKDGWRRERQSRMFVAGSPVFIMKGGLRIMEGGLRNTPLPYMRMLGAVVKCELRDAAHVF